MRKSIIALALAVSVQLQVNAQGIDPANMDLNEKPSNSFFNYVNGGWLKKTEIPASESRWGSFNEVNEYNRVILKNILDEAISKTNATKGSNWQLIGDFYASGLDSVTIQSLGFKPIQPMLASLNAIENSKSVLEALAAMHRTGGGGGFGFFVMGDLMDSKFNSAYLFQGGLGLPDRSYYLEDNEKFVKYREQYKKHIAIMLTKTGVSAKQAKKDALNIYNLELELAKASRSNVENRNIPKMYNKKTMAQLGSECPNINWKAYFKALGASNLTEIIVAQPEFFTRMSELLTEVPLGTWKAYLAWNVINNASTFLSDEFVLADHNFYNVTLKGVTGQKPRWKRTQELVSGMIGEPLGKLYVEKAFPQEAKDRMEAMINDIRNAFAVRIIELDWMTAETKVQALKKLNAIIYKIGYPDEWRDYSNLDIRRNDFYGNFQRTSEFEFDYNLSQANKPVDRKQWGMTPQTVNAYYNPTINEIVFPAGILQPPFFDLNAPDAVNYGGIGAVIAHELTHGFDDQGSQFDAEGNLKNWWSTQDLERFQAKTKGIIEQFNAYTVLNDVHVNGELTVGENIADLGGVTIAFDALQRSWKANGKPEEKDGFTPEQLFFLSFGTIWRTEFRDEALLERIKTDSHSPGMWRCNGTLMNFNEFYKAFNIPEGSPMRLPSNKATTIW